MQASNQQLTLSGILVVGIIAIGVDRLVLSDGVSGPAHAAAQPGDTPPTTTVDAPSTVMPSLRQQLRALALYDNLDLDHTTDAFSLNERDASLRPSEVMATMSSNERAFRETHRLIGVMADRAGGQSDDTKRSHTAFVEALSSSDSPQKVFQLKVGDIIDGFRVAHLGLPGTDNASAPFIVLLRNGVTFRLSTTDGR